MLELINTIILACTIHAQSEGLEHVRSTQKKMCIKDLILCVEAKKSTLGVGESARIEGLYKCLSL